MAAVRLSCRPPLLVVLCLFLMLSIHVPGGSSLSFNLRFSQPQSHDLSELIAFSGEAYLSPDTLELTRNSRDKSSRSSVGRATYVQRVPLWDAATREMASFTTTFSFRISRDNASYTGDGMAFFLANPEPAGIPANSSGRGLGLVPVSTTNVTGGGGIVAVELDTFLNPESNDTSDSHVGIDINSVNSTASTDATSPAKNLTSGYEMVATVRYENATNLLTAELTINDTRYSVNATVDLRSYLPEYVAVGFSAATGELTELHQVLSWSFSSTLEPKNVKSKQARVVRKILIPVALLVLAAACASGLLLLWQMKKHKRRSSSSDDSDSEQQRDDMARGVAAHGPRRYAYRELAAATNNFADDEKLGRGGFGSVYRGKLLVGEEDEHRHVAIKMFSSESSAQGRKEFEAEVRIISRLKHRNLRQPPRPPAGVRAGSPRQPRQAPPQQQQQHGHRDQVADVAREALRYLHHEWEQCVVHGDIKPSNIMLDESGGAKLGDFGLARLGDHGGRWHTTKAVLGTAGYIDPEFVNTRHPSTHSDVYSFGIVLLEMVSGRPPVILHEGGGPPPFLLLKWVWGLYGRGRILDAADERLRGGGGGGDDDRCMERVLVVGLWCAHPDQSERPSMAQAMHALQSEDARLSELPQQMYYRTSSSSGFAITGRNAAGSGGLSIEGYYSGDSSSATATTTGDSKISSGSSTTALLRDSKAERASSFL
nr:unnamed protein product [Digitaria exilis]